MDASVEESVAEPLDMLDLMALLAAERPIFHSEADFQHALAWLLHQRFPHAALRLEYRPFPDERFYLDIWVDLGRERLAIELKYPTRGIRTDVRGERFALKDHAAQDITRYDFLKDVARIERVVRESPGTRGIALLLTNDSAYWTESRLLDPVDAAFRLHEGRTISGALRWSDRTGLGTSRGREAELVLAGAHALAWRDYCVLPVSSYGRFRYTMVEVAAIQAHP